MPKTQGLDQHVPSSEYNNSHHCNWLNACKIIKYLCGEAVSASTVCVCFQASSLNLFNLLIAMSNSL